MIAAARRTVLLADHTKIGNDYFARFGDLDDVDTFITDTGADDRAGGRDLRGRTAGGAGVIVTLTLNPSLDRTVEVPALARGAVIRASSARLDPGGKGVNVARALLANGVDARAVLPVRRAPTATSSSSCSRPRAWP